jgi:teichuronic acid biosynthesis protein TuaE
MLGSAVIGIGISYGDFYLFHFFLFSLFMVLLVQWKNLNLKLPFTKRFGNYDLLFLVMFVWYAISILWAPDIGYAGKYIFYIFCGISISMTIIYFSKTGKKLNALFKTIGAVLLIDLFFALLESFTSFRLPVSPYSSLLPYFGKEAVNFSAFDNLLVYSDFRPPTGFHWNTNNLAVGMMMALPFFLCSHQIIVKALGTLAILIITVLAASRAVFLGLIIILCLYLVVVKKKIATLSLIWMAILGLFWGMAQLSESQNPRINEIANSIEALSLYLKGDIDVGGSLEWRRELVNNGLAALKESNGLGVGAGGSVPIQEKIGGVAGRFTSMHNFWIELLVEGGIIFFSLIMGWYISITYNLFKISKWRENPEIQYYGSALFLAMIGFVPAAIAASSTIYFFPMWIMFGLSISVIYAYRRKRFHQHTT